jgi:hypothetical protein
MRLGGEGARRGRSDLAQEWFPVAIFSVMAGLVPAIHVFDRG